MIKALYKCTTLLYFYYPKRGNFTSRLTCNNSYCPALSSVIKVIKGAKPFLINIRIFCSICLFILVGQSRRVSLFQTLAESRKLAPSKEVDNTPYSKIAAINYSSVFMLISLLRLIFTSKFLCFLYMLTRRVGLINMQTKE